MWKSVSEQGLEFQSCESVLWHSNNCYSLTPLQ